MNLKNKKKALLSQKKLYINDKGNIGYDLYLKENKCESTIIEEFEDNELVGITINYPSAINISNSEIEAQTIEMLKINYGEPTLVAPLNEQENSYINETVYHWLKGRKHITYINSSIINRHILEFHNSYKEANTIQMEIDKKRQIQNKQNSNGKSSKDDFK
jgi:hypothetical protein